MDDPYSPPAHLEYTRPAQTEDVVRAPKLMGVFSMIFAIITLVITSLFLYIYTAVGDGEDSDDDAFQITPTEAEDAFDEQMGLLGDALALELGLAQASAIGLMLMSGALIVLAIGQRRYRRWARIGSLAWAGLGLTLIAIAISYNYAVVQPAWEAILDGAITGGEDDSFLRWSGVLKYVLFIPYPIAMILVFAGSRVGRAMTRS
ncbi:MAG: hypothetical protein JRF63_12460 [Deltaproteobacteria bacterium]|nr:hypothetical protein [Deltaproteobacteria bacterium]